MTDKQLRTKSIQKKYIKYHSYLDENNICPFCVVDAKINQIINKYKHFYVTKNAFPYRGTELHWLIVVNRHVENIKDLYKVEENELARIGTDLLEKHPKASMIVRGDDDENHSLDHFHVHFIEYK